MTPQTLKAARAGLSLSQKELAREARVHRRTVCNFESGKAGHTPEVCERLQAALARRGVAFTDQGVTFSSES